MIRHPLTVMFKVLDGLTVLQQVVSRNGRIERVKKLEKSEDDGED